MSKEVNVLFGTETGNSEDLANTLTESLKAKGLEVNQANVEDISMENLAAMKNVALIISTWGDGDPPTSAEEFCYSLAEEKNIDLSGMQYGVLALGDTNYPEFCACGKQIDADFARLGAKAFLERKDLDTDFDYYFDEWQAAVVEALSAGVEA